MASDAPLLEESCSSHSISMVDASKKSERASPEEVPDDEIKDDRGEVKMGGCCGFGNNQMAMGYNFIGSAKGPLVMSNVFLSTSLIYLASKEVGCIDGHGEVMEDCHQRVFGIFRPSALITNIAVISGLGSALFMPLAGAVVDYTSHRWTAGVASAILMTVIQAIQIGTNSSTWFIMAVLQAIQGCFYQVQVLASYSYLSTMSREVSGTTMANYSSTFTMVQFGSQALFLLVVVGISMGLHMDDVRTAQLSQAINTVSILISFTLGWRLLPQVPPQHFLQKGESLIWQGFVQNWRTAKRINRDYKRSLRWFLLGVLFAEPAANAFTVVAVVFLNDQLKMSGTEIGVFFFVVLLAMIPGGILFRVVAHGTNASICVRFSMFMLFLLTVFAGQVLEDDNVLPLAYIWGFFVGLMLGCYYPGMKLFLSLVVPHGQEAEITGFYVQASQVLVWLPPLIFSTMVEAEIDQRIGVMTIGAVFLISIAAFSMAAPFDELLSEIHGDITTKGQPKSTMPQAASDFQLTAGSGESPNATKDSPGLLS